LELLRIKRSAIVSAIIYTCLVLVVSNISGISAQRNYSMSLGETQFQLYRDQDDKFTIEYPFELTLV
jgi:hypothetical protein